MSDIPIHHLQQQYDHKLDIMRLPAGNVPDADADRIHRDDHYNFFLFEEGTTRLMLDFQNLSFDSGSVYYILPGQVHRRINHQHAQGWFVAADTALIPADFRNVFENNFGIQPSLSLVRLCRCSSPANSCHAHSELENPI